MSLTPAHELSAHAVGASRDDHLETHTVQSSKKRSFMITPPVSTQPHTPHTPNSHAEKSTLVNAYLENAAVFITSIWHPWHHPVPSLFAHSRYSSSSALEAYTRFVTEILKRSRCSKTALYGALFYVEKLASQIQQHDNPVLNCPKKVFLVCLILSFKFQFDSTYNLKAWSKISGLNVKELKQLEMGVLKCLDYQLGINNDAYRCWVDRIDLFIKNTDPILSAHAVETCSPSLSSPKRGRDDDGELAHAKRAKLVCS